MNRKKHFKFGDHIDTCFECCNCNMPVNAHAPGTQHRNHCPGCLWSRHVDLNPGDRMSFCKGKMEPISIWIKDNGEWMLLHRCTNCGVIKPNRIAADDSEHLLRQIMMRGGSHRL